MPAQTPNRNIVGDQYEILQNSEAFDFFDILLKESGGKLQTAGAIGKGEKVWMLAKLPEVFYPLAGDGVEKFLLGTTSHDGTMKTEIRFTDKQRNDLLGLAGHDAGLLPNAFPKILRFDKDGHRRIVPDDENVEDLLAAESTNAAGF